MDSTYTQWTCDRCGVKETTDVGDQPRAWTAVLAICPPRADFHDTTRQALCRQCAEALIDFMAGAMVGVTA